MKTICAKCQGRVCRDTFNCKSVPQGSAEADAIRAALAACVHCKTPWTQVKCCCDEGTLGEHAHKEGVCVRCCGCSAKPNVQEGRGGYERSGAES